MARKKQTMRKDDASIEAIDIDILQQQILALRRPLERDVPLGLLELSQRIGMKQDELLYWTKLGILRPIPTYKGERRVGVYPLDEIEKALLSKLLKDKGWPPQKIAGAVPFWEHSSKQEKVATPSTELDQTDRAVMLLRARVLALIAQITANLQTSPRNCFLIARALHPSDTVSVSNTVIWEEIDKGLVENHIDNPLAVIGVSTDTGEMLLYFHNLDLLRSEIPDRTFIGACLRDSISGQGYEIIYGYIGSIGDNQRLLSQQKTSKELLSYNQEPVKWRFLFRLLHLLIHLIPEISTHFPLIKRKQLNTVEALVNFIPFLTDGKWDFSGFLVPANHHMLKIQSVSANYPRTLQDQLYPLETTGNYPLAPVSWVFNHQDHLIFEGILPTDPRLVDPNYEGIKSLAIIPAIVIGATTGVLLVGSHSKPVEGQFCFEPEDIQLLSVMARIIAESRERELLSNPDDVLPSLPKIGLPEQGEDDLNFAVRNAVDTLISYARAKAGMDNFIILLAIRLEGYGRLYTLNKTASEWFGSQIQRTLHLQIETIAQDEWDCPLPSRVFRLAGDQFVGLIGRTQSDIRGLRQEISNRLVELQQLIAQSYAEVTLHLWSVHFSYQDLAQQFDLGALKEKAQIERTVNHLLERTRGALKIVANIHQGDAYLRQRNFSAALAEYEIAELHDPGNPYVLRHKCECLTEIGQYAEAIRYGQRAVEADPGYAGPYRRLALAYLRQGNLEEAIMNYKEALHRAENDPSLYLSLAQVLILRAEKGDLDQVFDAITHAMDCDAPKAATRANYFRYKGEASMRFQKYDLAVNWYNQSLKLEPENKLVEWELHKARYELWKSGQIPVER